MNGFYLVSSEGYGLEDPRHCLPVRRLQGERRDDYLLVRISPPILGQNFGLGGQDIEEVILATRHQGESLFSISRWPVYVHVARLLDSPPDMDTIRDGEMELIGWAELYPTEADALAGLS